MVWQRHSVGAGSGTAAVVLVGDVAGGPGGGGGLLSWCRYLGEGR